MLKKIGIPVIYI